MSLPEQIFKTWINFFEFEEEQEGSFAGRSLTVYRTDRFTSPPAKFREKLTFKEDRGLILTVPDETEEIKEFIGYWQANDKDKTLLIFPEPHSIGDHFLSLGAILHIVEIDRDILKVRIFPLD